MSEQKTKNSAKQTNGSTRTYDNKNQVTVILERDGKRVFSRNFSCKGFSEKAANGTIMLSTMGADAVQVPVMKVVVDNSISVIKDLLKERAVDCLWNRTNLNKAQNEEQMREKLLKNAAKADDKLVLSFQKGGKFLGSGVIYLNDYPSDYRTLDGKMPEQGNTEQVLVDVLKNINTGDMIGANGGENLFQEIAEIFDYYLSDEDGITSIEETYQVKNNFPKIEDHYKEMIEKINKERKAEIAYYY